MTSSLLQTQTHSLSLGQKAQAGSSRVGQLANTARIRLAVVVNAHYMATQDTSRYEEGCQSELRGRNRQIENELTSFAERLLGALLALVC